MPRIVRTQKPPEHLSWKKAKPFLRIDFSRRCAYCHVPEARYGPPGNFHVDHFHPKSMVIFTHLVNAYRNLYYACADCNRYKAKAWPRPELQILGFYFVDPCAEDPLDHWRVNQNGAIEPTSHAGEYTLARLNLNRPYLVDWRAGKVRYLALRARAQAAVEALTSEKEDTMHATLAECLAEIDRKLAEYGQYW